MRRTVFGSATKFWPKARLGCSFPSASNRWISALEWVMAIAELGTSRYREQEVSGLSRGRPA